MRLIEHSFRNIGNTFHSNEIRSNNLDRRKWKNYFERRHTRSSLWAIRESGDPAPRINLLFWPLANLSNSGFWSVLVIKVGFLVSVWKWPACFIHVETSHESWWGGGIHFWLKFLSTSDALAVVSLSTQQIVCRHLTDYCAISTIVFISCCQITVLLISFIKPIENSIFWVLIFIYYKN